MIAQIQKFTSEVIVELKKVSWSTRQELIDSTLIVLTAAFFLEFKIFSDRSSHRR